MKTYFLVRSAVGQRSEWLTLFVASDEQDCAPGRRRAVPYCIGSEAQGGIVGVMAHVSMAILLDFFSGEVDCEVKSRLLSRPLAYKLNRIGAGDPPHFCYFNSASWSLTEAELGDLVADILVNAKQAITSAAQQWAEECLTLEVTGQRRAVLCGQARRKAPAKPRRRRLTEAERREATKRRIAFYFPKGEE